MKRSTGIMIGLLGSFTCLAGTASAYDPPPDPDKTVLILLDRTGSMAEPYECGLGSSSRKWECAVKKIKEWIKANDTGVREDGKKGTFKYWFWHFRMMRTDGDPHHDYEMLPDGAAHDFGRADLIDEVNPTPVGLLDKYAGPTSDDALTPLASATCKALDALKAEPLGTRELLMVTDGRENWTADDDKCKGGPSGSQYDDSTNPAGTPVLITPTPTSDTAPVVTMVNNLAVPTWQSNIFGHAVSGKIALASAPPTAYTKDQPGLFAYPQPSKPFVVHYKLFDNWLPGTMRAPAPMMLLSPSSGIADGERAQIQGLLATAMAAPAAASVTATASGNTYDDDAALFGGISKITGGRFQRYRVDGGGTPTEPGWVHAKPGDVDDSGCVDATDRQLLMQVLGQKVTPSNPNTFRSDLTGDGVVDLRDYRALVADWGDGCATPPAQPALPQQGLLGFEERSLWSSAAPLYSKMSPLTGGSYSLGVGGKNWREISSVAFDTAILQNVTSKIAYDVYIPTQQTNRNWLGQTLLFVNCPSAGIYNLSLGNYEFTGKPLGNFTTAQFNIPNNVKQAMQSGKKDFSFKVVINANDPGYVLDSMRFVP